jgi:hypothetical protein
MNSFIRELSRSLLLCFYANFTFGTSTSITYMLLCQFYIWDVYVHYFYASMLILQLRRLRPLLLCFYANLTIGTSTSTTSMILCFSTRRLRRLLLCFPPRRLRRLLPYLYVPPRHPRRFLSSILPSYIIIMLFRRTSYFVRLSEKGYIGLTIL